MSSNFQECYSHSTLTETIGPNTHISSCDPSPLLASLVVLLSVVISPQQKAAFMYFSSAVLNSNNLIPATCRRRLRALSYKPERFEFQNVFSFLFLFVTTFYTQSPNVTVESETSLLHIW